MKFAWATLIFRLLAIGMLILPFHGAQADQIGGTGVIVLILVIFFLWYIAFAP